MSSPVLIALGSEFLLLTFEQFQEALQRGRALVPQASEPVTRELDEILDADGMAEKTQIPASWFLEQARQYKLPHLRVGKYVRFEVAKVLEMLRVSPDTRTDGPHVGRKNTRAQAVSGACYHSATSLRKRNPDS
jgi:hypothetical protein